MTDAMNIYESPAKVACVGNGPLFVCACQRLAGKQVALTTWTADTQDAKALEEAGIAQASSLEQALQGVQVVCTFCQNSSEAEELYLKHDGLFKLAKPGVTLLDFSQASPELSSNLAEAAELLGMVAVDVPLEGTIEDLRQGKAMILAGADKEKLEGVQELLDLLACKVVYFGQPGQGQAARLCAQVAQAGALMAMSDTLALAEQSGLDLEQVCSMVGKTMGQTRVMDELRHKVIDGDYRADYSAFDMRRDLALAIQRSEELQVTLPGTETSFTLFDMLCQIGGSKLGVQAVSVLYQDEQAAVAAGLDWSLLESAAGDDDMELEDDELTLEALRQAAELDAARGAVAANSSAAYLHSHDHDQECGCGHDHHEHHHHGHDHECGCGHDHEHRHHHHDHGHECGCGHDHHHHHHHDHDHGCGCDHGHEEQ